MATTAITFFPMVAPVKPKGFYSLTPSRPSRVSMRHVSCPPRISMQCVSRLSSVPMKYAFFDWRRSIKHSDRGLSAVAAAAAAAATAGETKTVTRKSPTLTRVPGKAKDPKIADGGGGFPPREDNRGGGGGGGGGENSSGGFVLFGILAFLGFLKELDRDDKRGRRR